MVQDASELDKIGSFERVLLVELGQQKERQWHPST